MNSGIAEAGELNLGGETAVGYASNVFNRPSDDRRGGIDSARMNLRLHGAVKDELDRGEYRLSYEVDYFAKTAKDAGADWNHQAGFAATYNVSPRTSLTLGNQFLFLEKISLALEEPDAGAPPSLAEDPDIDAQNRLTIRNRLDLSATHFFSARWSGYTGANYTIFRDTDADDNDQDSNSVSGHFGTNYSLTKTMRIGLGGNATYGSFSGTTPGSTGTGDPGCSGQASPRSRTLSYSGFASIGYQFDPSTSLRVQAGPAQIESDFYLCPRAAPSFLKLANNRVTWFAQGEFAKRWSRVVTGLRYRRQQAISNGSDTRVTDVASGTIDWRLTRLWKLGVRGSWIRDSSLSGVETTAWRASTSLKRQFLRRLFGRASVSYRKETVSISRGGWDAWEVFLGIAYQLDPVHF